MNGHANGHTNGNGNGHTNGHANGLSNGDNVNGNTANGHSNGHASSAHEPTTPELEPIAVVGMGKSSSCPQQEQGPSQLDHRSHNAGCRLPGDVSSASEFWSMLLAGRSGQTPRVPAHRFNIDAHYHPRRDRPGSLPVLGVRIIFRHCLTMLRNTSSRFQPAPRGLGGAPHVALLLGHARNLASYGDRLLTETAGLFPRGRAGPLRSRRVRHLACRGGMDGPTTAQAPRGRIRGL